MERELESRIFMFEDYKSGDIKEDIKKYIIEKMLDYLNSTEEKQEIVL